MAYTSDRGTNKDSTQYSAQYHRGGRSLPPVMFPYINFMLKNISLTWRFDQNRPDYFTSMDHQRFVDKANKTTFSFTYVPQPGDNPNMIEEAVLAQRECCFQYGIAGLFSPTYRGEIVGYSVQMKEGALLYTFDIVSRAVAFNNSYIKSPELNVRAKGEEPPSYAFEEITSNIREEVLTSLDDGNYGEEGEYASYEAFINSPDGAWAINSEVDRGFKNSQDFEGIKNSAPDAQEILRVMREIVRRKTGIKITHRNGGNEISYIKKNAILNGEDIGDRLYTEYTEDDEGRIHTSYYKPAYKFDIEGSDSDFRPVATGINIQNLGPLAALKAIAKRLRCKSDPNKYYYTIVVDETKEEGEQSIIRLKKVDGNCSASLHYIFDWGSKNTDVISWDPTFDGAMILFDGTPLTDIGTTQTVEVEDGRSVTVFTKLSSFTDGIRDNWTADDTWNINDLTNKVVTNTNKFENAANYPYKARITVLGLLEQDLKLAETRVEIQPLVNGKLHHSAGIYTVIGITDHIDSNGFTTTLDLVRESNAYRSSDGDYKVKIMQENNTIKEVTLDEFCELGLKDIVSRNK